MVTLSINASVHAVNQPKLTLDADHEIESEEAPESDDVEVDIGSDGEMLDLH